MFKNKLLFTCLGLAVLAATEAPAADPSCFPKQTREPVAGTWEGTVAFLYSLNSPDLAPVRYAWTGDLHLELSFKSTAVTTYIPAKTYTPPCNRTPLGVKPQPCAPIEIVPAHTVEEGADADPEIRGVAPVSARVDIDLGNGDETARAQMLTKQELELEAGADVSGSGLLTAVKLSGRPSTFRFLSSSASQGSLGSTVSSGESTSGMANSLTATSRSNSGDVQTKSLKSGSAGTGPAADDGVAFGQKHEFLRLEIVDRDCATMKGLVDKTEFVNAVRGSGSALTVQRSEWSATYVDRDLDLERAVRQFAEQPIPSKLTWGYISGQQAEYQRFRGDKPSSYRLCVLSEASDKMFRIGEAGLRELVDAFPVGAAPAVQCAVVKQQLPLIRFMQLMADNCPVVDEAWQQVLASQFGQCSF